MAHYAFLNHEGIVTEVITGCDESNDIDWEFFYSEQKGLVCKKTSYNTRGGIHYDSKTGKPSENQSKAFRKNFAGIGYSYDSMLDAFIPRKPFESWVLDTNSCLWNAPIPMPTEGGPYKWDETSKSWIQSEQ